MAGRQSTNVAVFMRPYKNKDHTFYSCYLLNLHFLKKKKKKNLSILAFVCKGKILLVFRKQKIYRENRCERHAGSVPQPFSILSPNEGSGSQHQPFCSFIFYGLFAVTQHLRVYVIQRWNQFPMTTFQPPH